MNQEEHLYKLRYIIEPGEFSKEDLIKEGNGGCDKILICSILKEKEGSSYCWISGDGVTKKPLPIDEYFKAWFMLAGEISKNEDTLNWHKKIVDEAIKVVRETMKKMREMK